MILGIHSDNGSESINDTVAKLREKLRIDRTKSRLRHSNDKALAESKNAAVVRKPLGYAHIPQVFAREVNAFCREHLNPYVNFLRPCVFPRTHTDAKGMERKIYRYQDMMTPFETFKARSCPNQYLKPGISLDHLTQIALSKSDNEAAEQMNTARDSLFHSGIHRFEKQA